MILWRLRMPCTWFPLPSWRRRRRIWQPQNPILISCYMPCEAFCPVHRKILTCGFSIPERKFRQISGKKHSLSSRQIRACAVLITTMSSSGQKQRWNSVNMLDCLLWDRSAECIFSGKQEKANWMWMQNLSRPPRTRPCTVRWKSPCWWWNCLSRRK